MKKMSIAIISVFVFVLSACSVGKKGILFSTEYEIEDYCENAIIVSKSDGKVYGLLDNKGNEILPLNYDDIEFINKSNYVNGYDDMLYLVAEYEGEHTVFNIKGKELLTAQSVVDAIDLEIKGEKTEQTPFFKERDIDSYKLYNEKGDLIYTIPAEEIGERVKWINDKIYCYYIPYGNELTTYSYDGGKQVDNINLYVRDFYTEKDKMLAFGCRYKGVNNRSSDHKLISIASDGKVAIEKEFKGYSDFEAAITEKQNEKTNSNPKYNLYKSNNTWKLEDSEGNSLYEERYFEKVSCWYVGENDCVGLTNEDNQLSIIGRDGTGTLISELWSIMKRMMKCLLLRVRKLLK